MVAHAPSGPPSDFRPEDGPVYAAGEPAGNPASPDEVTIRKGKQNLCIDAQNLFWITWRYIIRDSSGNLKVEPESENLIR